MKKNDCIHIPDRLHELRDIYHLTQKEAAKRMGVTFRHYQNYEYGAGNVNAEDIFTLCRSLDISMDYFFCRTKDKYAHYRMPDQTSREELQELMDALKKGIGQIYLFQRMAAQAGKEGGLENRNPQKLQQKLQQKARDTEEMLSLIAEKLEDLIDELPPHPVQEEADSSRNQ